MNRPLFAAAFVAGAMAVVWVGLGFIPGNPLALVMTLAIGVVYGFGALELLLFRRATATLAQALNDIPDKLADLNEWVGNLHPSLQNTVRLRIEGERVGLPGPALAPYLVGLLVMLGMLGTFLGMVTTFNGAVFALEGTTDLQTIRSSLAAPIKGLGLAFGTSVAGVAASAMLGLMSALVRRERLQAAHGLDGRIATVFRGFSLTHQRQETYKALQLQAQALPGVVDKLQAMVTMMERQSQQLGERLLSNQDHFHGHIKGVYSDLAASVNQSLKDSLASSARLAADTLQPLAEATMAGMAHETERMGQRMISTTQSHLDTLSMRMNANASTMADSWTAALAQQDHSNAHLLDGVGKTLQRFSDTFEQRSASLVGSVADSFAGLQAKQAIAHQQQAATFQHSLESMASTLQREWQLAGNQTLAQQRQICTALDETARQITGQAQASTRQTLAEVTRLLDAAAEAPRAAAQVIGELREELSSSMVRDNALLEERSRMMETLSALLDAINHASDEQRASIDSLVGSSAVLLRRVGSQFADKLEAESARLTESAGHVTSSAVEVAALSESFNFAVQLFTQANDKLINSLQRIESSMDKSLARSDDQLGYYVAQARELIDLSVMSQKEVVDDLRKLTRQQASLTEEVN